MNNKKKKYGVGVLAVTLIIGLSIGVCAGFAMGGRFAGKISLENESKMEENMPAADNQIADDTSDDVSSDIPEETDEKPAGSFAFDEDPVLTINHTTIYLDEINARVYMARDQYVSQYGEEPWNTEMENGLTVGEYAKNTMLEEMQRVTILCGKAGDYGVEGLTDEQKAKCAMQADDYMASLGSVVAAQFSVDRNAMLSIYEKDALSMNVYNRVLEELTDALRAEDSYRDMEDSEFEEVLKEHFDELYESWKNECEIETTETWDHLEIGAMG